MPDCGGPILRPHTTACKYAALDLQADCRQRSVAGDCGCCKTCPGPKEACVCSKLCTSRWHRRTPLCTTSACRAAQWVPDADDERPCLWTASPALMWSQSTASSFTPARACSTQPDDHVQEHEGKCIATGSLRDVWARLVHKDGTASGTQPGASRREQRADTARSFIVPCVDAWASIRPQP